MKQKLMLLLIMLLLAAPVCAQMPQTQDALIISMSSDFEPFTFLNKEGKPAGMLVDIWRLWSEKTGRHIAFISSDWRTSLENLKNQKAAIHSGLLVPDERFEWMSGSQPFYEVGVDLFYPSKQRNISDISDLSGQPVAIIGGTRQEQFLQTNYPGIRPLVCGTREELVKATRNGTAMGFITISHAGTAAIDRMGLSGEFDAHKKILYTEKMRAGVLKENSELLALVNEGLNAISNRELAEIEARWIPDPANRSYKAANTVQLAPNEEAWLRNHKTIRVGISPVVPPLKFSEGGVIKGIEPDYLNLLAEYTGLQFEYVICDFQEMDAKVQSGELDMFISFNIPERLAYMTFTEPLMEFKQVIISRLDAPFMSGIGALQGKRLAVVKGVKLYEKLLRPYPEIEVVQVNDSDAMFEAVATSKADALIARTYTAGYVMHNYPNLKITGLADLPPEPLLYAIRKDYPHLVAILNKAIAAITKEKHDAIAQKWSRVQIEYRPHWAEILKWALIIGSAFTFLLGVSFFWNRRLRREIDIRTAIENALRQSEQRRRLALELAGAGTWEWDLLTNENFWSDELWFLYDLDPHSCEPSYAEWQKTVHPDDLPEAEQTIQQAVLKGLPLIIEWRVQRRDGTERWLMSRGVPFKDGQDGIRRYLGTVVDITERKQADEEREKLQNQLTQAQKMESIGRLAGGVAHDFNNMLSVIIGYAELALDQIDPSSPLHQDLQEIYNAGKRSADITQQLLAFARKQTIAPRILDLNETVEGMLRMLQRLIGEDITLAWLPGLGLSKVKLDPSQLDQMLANLCVNARDAITGVGKVTVETGMVTFDDMYCHDHPGFTPGDFILLSFSDDGCGMDEEIVLKIFEPFFTTKEVGQGTGLGLATVYGIVKQNNGFVTVYSEPGHGTTFKIYLPVHQSDSGAIQAETIPDSNLGGTETVLIVEDDASVLQMSKNMLEKLGYTVLTANTAADAIQLAEENAGKIDLLITDVVMPEMNGRDVADQVHTLVPGIKILFMSGYTAEVIAHRGILDAGVCFIHKPFSINDFAVKVREALEQE